MTKEEKKELIINTINEKQRYINEITNLCNKFIFDFNSSGLDYELESNINNMLILLKGDILESEIYKKINKDLTVLELEKEIYNIELSTGENLDDVKININLYKELDNINELYKDLKSILVNTLNLVLENDYSELYIDDNIVNDIKNSISNGSIDEEMAKNLLEFVKFVNESKLILNNNI